MGDCGCAKCEELLQPFVDRELTEAERHRRRGAPRRLRLLRTPLRFETTLRMYVRKCCDEPMPYELGEAQARLTPTWTPLWPFEVLEQTLDAA